MKLTQEEAAKPKLCINCKHYRPAMHFQTAPEQAEYARCAASFIGEGLPLVDGRDIDTMLCYIARKKDDTGCSTEGRLFEPK